ncbi:hypothetical protein [Gracilimonas tropica]|uniref:hypothetical protein n=1 Tax=Gracilimonas tropica TaxID=454600 RepID=UPI000372AFCD|nr:hypothetical protein [Gracilimonas tropica]
MGKKKSLGHNPLAYSTRSHASFDFIAPSNEKEKEEKEEGRVHKETASYYLESPLVNKIKAMADEQDTSYSSIVNDILKRHLQETSG